MSGAVAPLGGRAMAHIYTVPPEFAHTMAEPTPVFLRPSIKENISIALTRLLRSPVRTRRAWRATGSLKYALAATMWSETAEWFGYETVRFDEGHPVQVSDVLRPPRHQGAGSDSAAEVTGLVIALNEAALIGRALDSLRPWVDRLLLVDGGSTDETVTIAHEAGAEVIHRPFNDDFSAQRNAGLEAVRTAWVLTIDSDETIPAELGAALRGYAMRGAADAVLVPRLNLVGDDPQPTLFPDLHARLFRSHLRYRGRLHERVRPRTRAYLPLNGPQLQHHKSPLRHYRNQLLYDRIVPGALTPDEVAKLRETVDRLSDLNPNGELPP